MRLTGSPRSPGLAPTLASPALTRPVAHASPLQRAGARPHDLGGLATLLVMAGVCYNALLALLNARGLPVSMPVVAATEFLILAAAAVTLLRSGLGQGDAPPLLLLGFFLVDAVLLSLVNGVAFPEMARNAAVIAIFLMIGARVEQRTLVRTFAVAAILVAAILLLESLSVSSYAALLEPGRYFEQTRGISRFELDEIGLFANALGFDDRFSILNIVGHRTSSLFLEQVSLANFATVLTIFLVALWGRLPLWLRIFLPLLVVGILVTNNSRTALAIALAAPPVYFIAPHLPRLITLGLMPVILLAALIVSVTAPPSKEDDLVGRLNLTIETLRNLDLSAVVGARAVEASKFLDSGYTFVIYASSIIGLLVLWFFFSVIGAGGSVAQKRGNLMTGLYLFLNLTVSGTSVFSIKTAALLWMLMGFLRRDEAGEAKKPPRDLAPAAPASPYGRG